jgi:hypothetical protein
LALHDSYVVTGPTTGARTGGPMGMPMLTPMAIPLPILPRSMSPRPPRSPSSRPPPHLSGTIVRIPRATTPMSTSVPVAGERWLRVPNRGPGLPQMLTPWALKASQVCWREQSSQRPTICIPHPRRDTTQRTRRVLRGALQGEWASHLSRSGARPRGPGARGPTAGATARAHRPTAGARARAHGSSLGVTRPRPWLTTRA